MISFEKELKKRVLVQIIKAITIGVLVMIACIIKVRLHGNIESVSAMDRGILFGMFFGAEVSSIKAIQKYRKALKTPEILEELHIKEVDERNRVITLRTCKTFMYMSITLLSVAGMITAFFSQVIFMTISIILVALLVLYGVLAMYYSGKY